MSWTCQDVFGEEFDNEALTVYCKANEEKHSGLQRNDVH